MSTTFMDKILADLKTGYKEFCAWFGSEEQAIVIAAKPALVQLGKLAATDLWNTILAAVPLIAAASGGNYEAALAAAITMIKNTLEKEAIILSKSALGIAANIVTGQVELAISSGAVTIPAPAAPAAPVVANAGLASSPAAS